MSHFTKIKTKIYEIEILKSALNNLGYKFSENVSSLKDYQGRTTNIDLLINLNSSYDIGFHRTIDGSYEIVADWYGVKVVTKESFISNLMQTYSLELIEQEMKKKGYNIVVYEQFHIGSTNHHYYGNLLNSQKVIQMQNWPFRLGTISGLSFLKYRIFTYISYFIKNNKKFCFFL